MGKVTRVYPGPNNGLIRWIEENFGEIDGYAATFKMRDGTVRTIYDALSPVDAIGMAEIGKSAIQEAIDEDEFVPRP
ncbi:hypothetical protein MHB78_01155 [Bacillus sp. FSL K6-0138]|uniref:hypothetical protein n=1 Tax=Bacillus TaxID=1386 RepID=UPI0011AAC9CC|nr:MULTISPECIES: hypothetical protein [Bacillus]MBU8788029.1 hypothetical protein [Bacillus glycinifermentans]MED4373898.1 hypothetical protein [Bacillus licheniformis]TWL19742.1 hypothetical protein CHCC16874_2688 [Bacillus licheniformis]